MASRPDQSLSLTLDPNRYFDPEPTQRRIAGELYESVASYPLICPHGHVDPGLFANPDATFRSPTELFLIPDHYIYRMLYSQGIPLEALGVPSIDGSAVEKDMRKIWQIFAENFHLFRGTPTGIWITEELVNLFEIKEKLGGQNAQAIYDQIEAQLALEAFKPRRLFERFNIEVLSTTDPAWDALEQHQAILESGWQGRVIPSFRPDALVNLGAGEEANALWRENLTNLEKAAGREIGSYASFIQALEERRAHFLAHGAKATDHAGLWATACWLADGEAEVIFQRALRGQTTLVDAARFTAHMFMEMARMSYEDGLVMQLHIGAYRDHIPAIYKRFGRDKGADIPIPSEFTRALQPLLVEFGGPDPRQHSRFNLIVFTLDETTYARELAPLAGLYPALKLGPPWWFHDSLNGMQRYLDQVTETAGLYNLAGFNDDTRAFPSIPARHDVWRRSTCNWVAGLAARHIVDMQDAFDMARLLAYDLAKKAYRI